MNALLLVLALSWGFEMYSYGTWVKVEGFQTRQFCQSARAQIATAMPGWMPENLTPLASPAKSRCVGSARPAGSIIP